MNSIKHRPQTYQNNQNSMMNSSVFKVSQGYNNQPQNNNEKKPHYRQIGPKPSGNNQQSATKWNHETQNKHFKQKIRPYNHGNKAYKKYQRRKKRHTSKSSSSSSSSSGSSNSYQSSSSSSYSQSSRTRRHRVPHFKFRINQKLNSKYRVISLLGDGTFGRVVECIYNYRSYAIKIIKPVAKYTNSARVERDIIRELNRKDQNDNHHIIQYIESFYHGRLFCMVFQLGGISLYKALQKNNYKGFPLKQIQIYLKQILIGNQYSYLRLLYILFRFIIFYSGLSFLSHNGYTHTDLKPQNILYDDDEVHRRNILEQREDGQINGTKLKRYSFYTTLDDKIRIIDFGGATKDSHHHSNIINTRQYRAPQVMLGFPKWNQTSDLWSLGCIVAELYTGELLFPTHNDEQHLAMINKILGPIPNDMVMKGNYTNLFKDGYIQDNKSIRYQNIIGLKSIAQIFQDQPQIQDLLYKLLEIDPRKRIRSEQALKHEFFLVNYINHNDEFYKQ